MASSKTLLNEIAQDLDAILTRTVDSKTLYELKRDSGRQDAETELAVWATMEDLRKVALRLSIVVERLVDVTNLETIESRVERWPHPSTISLAEHEEVH